MVKPAFLAPQQLADDLQGVHLDLIDLHLQAKQAHWNVVGRNFRDLHLQLDEVVDAARGFSDDVAERMRAIAITPDGRSVRVAAESGLAPFPSGEVQTAQVVELVADAIYAACARMRRIHDRTDDVDPTSAELLHQMLERLEQLAWLVAAENRRAGETRPLPIQE